MRTNTQRLSPRENAVLRLLAKDRTYQQIREDLGITPQNLASITAHIREKTGIQHTQDAAECRRYIRAHGGEHRQTPFVPAPIKRVSPQQMEVLRLLSHGRTYQQIAQSLDITIQGAQNVACTAAKRAGIAHAGWRRTQLIREYLAKVDHAATPALRDPMSDPMF